MKPTTCDVSCLWCGAKYRFKDVWTGVVLDCVKCGKKTSVMRDSETNELTLRKLDGVGPMGQPIYTDEES